MQNKESVEEAWFLCSVNMVVKSHYFFVWLLLYTVQIVFRFFSYNYLKFVIRHCVTIPSRRCPRQCWDNVHAVSDNPRCPWQCWDIFPAVLNSAVTICRLSRTVLWHSPCCSGQYFVKSAQFLWGADISKNYRMLQIWCAKQRKRGRGLVFMFCKYGS